MCERDTKLEVKHTPANAHNAQKAQAIFITFHSKYQNPTKYRWSGLVGIRLDREMCIFLEPKTLHPAGHIKNASFLCVLSLLQI